MAYNLYDLSELTREDHSNMKKIKALTKTSKQDDTLSEKESLSKLTQACEGCTNDDACCAIVGLKKAGWDVSISEGINHEGRKGIVISCTEPAKFGS